MTSTALAPLAWENDAATRQLIADTLTYANEECEEPLLVVALTQAAILRLGQPEAAAHAHRAVLRAVQSDLAEIGFTHEALVLVLARLAQYLNDGEGWQWRDGAWHAECVQRTR